MRSPNLHPIRRAAWAVGIVMCLALGSNAKAQQPWTGSGTEADPFLISAAADLSAIGADQNHWDKHFRLTGDIDMGGAGIDPPIGVGNSFDDESKFSGVIDGAGFALDNFVGDGGLVIYSIGIIRDLGMRNPQLTMNTHFRAGAFADENGGLIENCYVDGGNVAGGAMIGGIAGYNHNGGINGDGGQIVMCWTSCTVSSIVAFRDTEYAGGIVGWNSGRVIGCRSSATITGGGVSGGIAGRGGSILLSHSSVTCNGASIFGGIAGSANTSIKHCYSTATANGASTVGGLTGEQTFGDAIGSFWDTDASGIATSASGTGLDTAAMQSASTYADASWELVGTDVNGASEHWSIPAGGGYPVLWWDMTTPPAPTFAGGSGTEADPYLIADATQWKSIARRVDYLRSHYRLAADIDLTGLRNVGIGSSAIPLRGSIDGASHSITGFATGPTDAFGSALIDTLWRGLVRDLTIVRPVLDRPPGFKTATLVGTSWYGDFQNITVTEPDIVGDGWAAGLIETCYRSAIANCHVIGGNITADGGRAAGLVGDANDTPIQGCTASCSVTALGELGAGGFVGKAAGEDVVDCHASGDVSGTSGVGGFSASRANCIRCSATGDVSGEESVGGFSGGGGVFQQCFATGNVTATGDDVGGFIGNEGAAYDCYAHGDVSGRNRVGGFVGSHRPHYDTARFNTCYASGAVVGVVDVGGFNGAFTDSAFNPLNSCYWDIASSGVRGSAGGQGHWPGAMRSRPTFYNTGWDFGDTWTIAPGEYPQLQWVAGGQLFVDADDDEMPDAWEAQHAADITAFNPDDDDDGDGVSNFDEYRNGTDPKAGDSDGDGFTDRDEIGQLTDPNDDASRPSGLTQRLVPTDPPPNEVLRFGHDVAISGDTIVVGAPGSVPGQVAPLQITIPGDPDHHSPGVVFVFRRTLTDTGPRWQQILKLEPTDPIDIGFGSSVDIDGDTVAVGCWNPAAYVFELDAPDQATRLDVFYHNPDADFDPPTIPSTLDVALHRDTLLIGSPTDNEADYEAGAAYFFEREGGSWELADKVFGALPKSRDRFGVAVSLWGRNGAIGSGPYSQITPEREPYFRNGEVQIYRDPVGAGGWHIETQISQPMAQEFTVERFGSEISLHRDFLAASGINSNNDGDYPPTAGSMFYRHASGISDWGDIATPDFNFGHGNLGDSCFCYEGPFKMATRGRTLLIGTTRGTYIMGRRFLDFENWKLERVFYPEQIPAATVKGESEFGSAIDLSGLFIVAGAAVSDSVWVTPRNEPAPFLEWLARFFDGLQLGDPEIAALSADPDNDGLNNGLEFALGLDPTSAEEDVDYVASIQVGVDNTLAEPCMTYTFSLPEPMPDGITHSVQASDNLVGWQTIANRTPDGTWTGEATISEHIADDGRLCVTVHDTVEIPQQFNRYLRLGIGVAN